MGVVGLLFVVFLVLKLAHLTVISTWSWWWITSPLWISAIVSVVVLAATGGFMLLFNRIMK